MFIPNDWCLSEQVITADRLHKVVMAVYAKPQLSTNLWSCTPQKLCHNNFKFRSSRLK